MLLFDLPENTPCSLCNRPLTGTVARDPTGQYLCASHVGRARQCRFCDRAFLPAQGRESTCSKCVSHAVTSETAVSAQRDLVSHWFLQHGLRLPRTLPEIVLRRELPPSPLLRGTRMLGYVESRRDFWGHETSHIVMERGLPAALACAVLTHELGHILIATHRLALPTWAEEGSCEWLAHRFLGTLRTAESLIQQHRIERRQDPTYGVGFQWVLSRLKHGDPHALIPLLQSHWSPSCVNAFQ